MSSSINVRIVEIGPKGDGISIYQGKPVFIEGGAVGDEVEVRLFRSQDLLRGQILYVIKPSPDRQSAPCSLYEQCGNCHLQHLKETIYRAWKEERVRRAIKNAEVKCHQWKPPIFLTGATRRRATFTVVRKGNQSVMGYYKRRSRTIFDVPECLILDKSLLRLRSLLKEALNPLLVNEAPLDVFVQKVGSECEVVLTGPLKVRDKNRLKIVFRQMAETLALARIGTRARVGDPVYIWLNDRPFKAKFGVLTVPLPPQSFLQPSFAGEEALGQAVLAEKKDGFVCADLFSGCGTFSGRMLSSAQVDAFENDRAAIQALRKAGQRHPLQVFQRDLYRSPLRREELNRYDLVVMDPPRAGCLEQAKQLAVSKVPKLILISCNPATFARDARALCRGSYGLKSVQVIDQFQWSYHVEIVGVFERR